MNKVACYTAIAGDYDPLRTHPEMLGVDWIAFLDGKTYQENVSRSDWDVRYLHAPMPDITIPRMRAKWYKTMSYMELPEYEKTFWIDGSVQLSGTAFIRASLDSDAPLTLFRHPDRDDIYDEARAAMGLYKHRDSPLFDQVDYYRVEYEHPEHWGLWATTMMGRTRCALTQRIEQQWWREMEQWGPGCQISLPVILRFLGYRPNVIKGNLWNHPEFTTHMQVSGP